MNQRAKRAEKKAGARAMAKAAGITFFAAGGITVCKEARILDHGVVRIDSVIRVDGAGGAGGGRVRVSDGGSAIRCERHWAISEFALGRFDALDEDAVAPGEKYGARLKDAVHKAALSIILEAPRGDVLLMGSTDAKKGENTDLADGRALAVKDLLGKEFGTARPISTIGDQLKEPTKSSPGSLRPPPGPSIADRVARLLLGSRELGTRTVYVCVGEPQPQQVEVGPVEGAGWSFVEGIAFGIGAALTLLGLAWLLRPWLRKKMTPPPSPAGKPAAPDRPRAGRLHQSSRERR